MPIRPSIIVSCHLESDPPRVSQMRRQLDSKTTSSFWLFLVLCRSLYFRPGLPDSHPLLLRQNRTNRRGLVWHCPGPERCRHQSHRTHWCAGWEPRLRGAPQRRRHRLDRRARPLQGPLHLLPLCAVHVQKMGGEGGVREGGPKSHAAETASAVDQLQ